MFTVLMRWMDGDQKEQMMAVSDPECKMTFLCCDTGDG